jgi:hypothetical protein
MATAVISGMAKIPGSSMYEGADGNKNYGGSANAWVCGSGGAGVGFAVIFKLETAWIPLGNITGLRFTALCNRNSGSGTPNIYLYRVKNSVVIGSGLGGVQAGSICWNYRVYNTVSWGTAGCLGSDVDYYSDASPPTAVCPASESARTWTLPVSWATGWRDGALVNNGLMFYLDAAVGTSAYIRRSGYSTEPYFEIDYIPVGTAGGSLPSPSVSSFEHEEANERWITELELGKMGMSWRSVGRKAVQMYGLGDEFDGFMGHYRNEKNSEERACKLALTDLLYEYGLDFVNDGRK